MKKYSVKSEYYNFNVDSIEELFTSIIEIDGSESDDNTTFLNEEDSYKSDCLTEYSSYLDYLNGDYVYQSDDISDNFKYCQNMKIKTFNEITSNVVKGYKRITTDTVGDVFESYNGVLTTTYDDVIIIKNK